MRGLKKETAFHLKGANLINVIRCVSSGQLVQSKAFFRLTHTRWLLMDDDICLIGLQNKSGKVAVILETDQPCALGLIKNVDVNSVYQLSCRKLKNDIVIKTVRVLKQKLNMFRKRWVPNRGSIVPYHKIVPIDLTTAGGLRPTTRLQIQFWV